MLSFLRLGRRLWKKKPLTPIQFASTGFELIDESHLLEEESFDNFKSGDFYPIRIGEVLNSKYQVVGKLGFGSTSTVWLARDLQEHGFATLKVYTRQSSAAEEFKIYRVLSKGRASHPGFPHVRTALDLFTIPRQGGDHQCLVQRPMWDSFKDLLKRNPSHRFTEDLLKAGLQQIFLALTFLHEECNIVHTDIKADNILIEIDDNSVLEAFVKEELEHPSPRKVVNADPIYMSRRFRLPKKFGRAVLSDFGSAVSGSIVQSHDAQPNVYRCPEVMLKTAWSYPADIWNVGCMIWDIFEDKHLFHGQDPDGSGYKTRAHLAEVVAILGPPPGDLLSRGQRSREFFDEDGGLLKRVLPPGIERLTFSLGRWTAGIDVIDSSLEASEENLTGDKQKEFLRFMRLLLQWRPEDRRTAEQLLADPWLSNV